MTTHNCDLCLRPIAELQVFILKLRATSCLGRRKDDINRELCPECAAKIRPLVEDACVEVSSK